MRNPMVQLQVTKKIIEDMACLIKAIKISKGPKIDDQSEVLDAEWKRVE